VESTIGAFWVAQPPDGNPEHYGVPMRIAYSEVHDQIMQQNCFNEMVRTPKIEVYWSISLPYAKILNVLCFNAKNCWCVVAILLEQQGNFQLL